MNIMSISNIRKISPRNSLGSRFAIILIGYLISMPPILSKETNSHNSGFVKVDFGNGLISLKADNASWQRILDEIYEHAGIQIHYPYKQLTTMSTSFSKLSVIEMVERLFGRGSNIVLRYRKNTGPLKELPAEIWVLKETANRNEYLTESTEKKFQNKVFSNAAIRDDHVSWEASALHDQNPEMRIQALANLIGHGSEDKLGAEIAVKEAANDQDMSVRRYVMQAAAMLPRESAIEILSSGMKDADPDVRLMAVENTQANEQERTLLELAANDESQTVRTIALSRLQQMETAATNGQP